MLRLLLLALLLAAAPLSASRAAEPRELVVGVEELDYYPAYAWVEQEYVGAARDILDAFARDRNYRIAYRPLPIKRLFQELTSGTIDAKFPDSPNWATDAKRDAAVHYSQPVIASLDGVMVPPAALGAGLGAIRVLGTVSGFTPHPWAGRIQSGEVAVKENPRLDLLLRQTVLRRVDGAYVSVAAAHHTLDRVLGMPGALAFDPGLPHARDSYRLSSTRHPELIAEFDAWLKANQGRVADIKRRFGAEKGVVE